jgi:hypothetical protein
VHTVCSTTAKLTAPASVNMFTQSCESFMFERLATVCVLTVVSLTFLHHCWHHCHQYHCCRLYCRASSAAFCSQELSEGLCSERTVSDKTLIIRNSCVSYKCTVGLHVHSCVSCVHCCTSALHATSSCHCAITCKCACQLLTVALPSTTLSTLEHYTVYTAIRACMNTVVL